MKRSKSDYKDLVVDAKITSTGISVYLNKDEFPIIWPEKIWKAYPTELKEILKDTLAHSSTFYVPQILRKTKITYKTARPLAETFFFKNGIYDIPYCAIFDGRSSTDDLKFFFKTQYVFEDNEIKTPSLVAMGKPKSGRKKTAVIPFSNGKESLLSLVLAKELGLEPVLVGIVDPSHKYEYLHKKPLIEQFEKETGHKVHVVEYNPGWFWEGRLWNIKTELGWGLHVTEYQILMLPFVHYFNADYLIVGNEQSCKDTYIDNEDVFIYMYGYDQNSNWTQQQALLCSLLCGRKIQTMSLVEPLYELGEVKLLHTRYSEYGKYQMSCFAVNEEAKDRRWCQNCSKCAYMFPMFSAFGVDPKTIGFTDNMFEKKYMHLYRSLFSGKKSKDDYGSRAELATAFYLAMKAGCNGYIIEKFKKDVWPTLRQNKKKNFNEYLGVHNAYNIPKEFKDTLLRIYNKELKEFKT